MALDPINFTRGVPADESFPLEEIQEAATDILKKIVVAIMQYGPSLGYAPLR